MKTITTKPKARKSLIASAVAAVGILGSLLTIQASAATKPTTAYWDSFSNTSTSHYEFGKHIYYGRSIWATDIQIKATSRVDYVLQLYFDEGTSSTQVYPNVICDTDNLGGSFWWRDVIKDSRVVAHMGFERIDGSNSLMYGKLGSAGINE